MSFSSRSTAPENWLPSLLMVATTVLRLSINCCTVWLLSASAVGERRRLGEQRLQVAVLALQNLDQRIGQRVDRLRVEALHNGFEAAQQQVEIQRRLGAVGRDHRSGRLDLRRSGAVDEFQVPVADQVEVAHRRLGARGEHDVAVGAEADEHGVVRLQVDLVDRSDPHSRDAHRVARLEAGGVGEHRRVGVVRPARYWPKIANSTPVSISITTPKMPTLIDRCSRRLLIRAARSARCCGAGRRAVRTAPA